MEFERFFFGSYSNKKVRNVILALTSSPCINRKWGCSAIHKAASVGIIAVPLAACARLPVGKRPAFSLGKCHELNSWTPSTTTSFSTSSPSQNLLLLLLAIDSSPRIYCRDWVFWCATSRTEIRSWPKFEVQLAIIWEARVHSEVPAVEILATTQVRSMRSGNRQARLKISWILWVTQ